MAGKSSDDPSLMLPGQTFPTMITWKVREASICTIGSNHNALALYDTDNKRIDLDDKGALIKLFDIGNGIHVSPKNKTQMTILTGLLKLSDNASEQAIADEVQKIIRLRDELQKENDTLKTEKEALSSKVQAFEKKKRMNEKPLQSPWWTKQSRKVAWTRKGRMPGWACSMPILTEPKRNLTRSRHVPA